MKDITIPSDPNKRCRNCVWWEDAMKSFSGTSALVPKYTTGDDQAIMGRCHFNAPYGVYAEVREDFYCGDFTKLVPDDFNIMEEADRIMSEFIKKKYVEWKEKRGEK